VVQSPQFALLLLCLTLGIISILTPYATGPGPVDYGSGDLPAKHFWTLGAVSGPIFIVVLLAITLPWMAFIG
jgi:L-tartrate/succinate antiporter